MTTPIFDSIINGALSPMRAESASVPFATMANALRKLPEDLTGLERLIEQQLGQYIAFNFAAERAKFLGISVEEYHPLPSYKYPIKIEAFPEINETPEHRFFANIITAESRRVKLALAEYSVTAKADIDTRGEVRRTLEGLYHLSLQLKSVLHGQVIKYSLKQQMLTLYYEIAATYSYLLPEDKVEPFDDYYYQIFGKYPDVETKAAFDTARLLAKAQLTIEAGDIETQKSILPQFENNESLRPVAIWLKNSIFAESFCFSSQVPLDTDRGSRSLARAFQDTKKTEYNNIESKAKRIQQIETDIEVVSIIAGTGNDSVCAASLCLPWLRDLLQTTDELPGSGSSEDTILLNDGLRYKNMATKVEQIRDLYNFLIKENKIASDVDYTNFKRIFTGSYATPKIKWSGDFSELMAMFKQMNDDGVLVGPNKIWESVSLSFVRKDGNSFTAKQINGQHPSAKHYEFATKASNLLKAE